MRRLHACLQVLSHYYARNVISSKQEACRRTLIPNVMMVYPFCSDFSKVIAFLDVFGTHIPVLLRPCVYESVEELDFFFFIYYNKEIKS